MNEAAWYSIFIGTAFKGTIALCLAWWLAFLLRRRSAATRHLVWTAAAAAVTDAALPFRCVAGTADSGVVRECCVSRELDGFTSLGIFARRRTRHCACLRQSGRVAF
jgi:hypothetical protein